MIYIGYFSLAGEFPKSVSKSCPNVVAPEINVYGWAPDVVEDVANQKEAEYKVTKPFITF